MQQKNNIRILGFRKLAFSLADNSANGYRSKNRIIAKMIPKLVAVSNITTISRFGRVRLQLSFWCDVWFQHFKCVGHLYIYNPIALAAKKVPERADCRIKARPNGSHETENEFWVFNSGNKHSV